MALHFHRLLVDTSVQKDGFHRLLRATKNVQKHKNRPRSTHKDHNTRSLATSRVPRLYRPMSAELRNNCACDVTVAFTPYICSKNHRVHPEVPVKTPELLRRVRFLLFPRLFAILSCQNGKTRTRGYDRPARCFLVSHEYLPPTTRSLVPVVRSIDAWEIARTVNRISLWRGRGQRAARTDPGCQATGNTPMLFCHDKLCRFDFRDVLIH